MIIIETIDTAGNYLHLVDHVASVEIGGVPSIDDIGDGDNDSVHGVPPRLEVVDSYVVLDSLDRVDERQLRLNQSSKLLFRLQGQRIECAQVLIHHNHLRLDDSLLDNDIPLAVCVRPVQDTGSISLNQCRNCTCISE